MREVIRAAKVGEYIKLTSNSYSFNKVGDILKVSKTENSSVGLVRVLVEDHPHYPSSSRQFGTWSYLMDEYVVLEGYKEEESNMFKYEDFKTGDIILYESGRREIVYLNTENGDLRCALCEDGMRKGNSFAWLGDFNLTDMCSIAGGKASKIMRAKYVGFVGYTTGINNENYRTVWERKNEVKEMTVEEISKALGYEVKVIKG